MGVDFLDLAFRVQKEFQIKLKQDFIMQVLEEGYTNDPIESQGADMRVSTYVRLIEDAIEKQHGSVPDDVYERVKVQLIKCLGVAPSEVTPEAWLIRDLKME